MFWLLVLSMLALTSAQNETCQLTVMQACWYSIGRELKFCSAKYGDIDSVEYDIQSFINKNMAHSFQYLLMSTHYGNYQKNREGFKRLFKSLSDESWNNAVKLIKYLTKRGGKMDFNSFRQDYKVGLSALRKGEQYELYELESLAKALDIQKSIAEEVNRIHLLASRDSEMMSYIQENFVHQLASSIRMLSGHTNDLKKIMASNKHHSLHIHLFDNYLQKLHASSAQPDHTFTGFDDNCSIINTNII